MVAYRQMLPVGKQCIFWITKHFTHIGGMLHATVEVRVIPNLYGQKHLYFLALDEHLTSNGMCPKFLIFLQKKLLYPLTDFFGFLLTQTDQFIEAVFQKNPFWKKEVGKEAFLIQNTQINDLISNCHTDSRAQFFAFEHPKRKAVNRKVRVLR